MNNYTEVYPDWSNDRSPNSMRGYHPAPQRQSSRLFEGANYGGPPQQGLYTAEDHHAPRYEPASQEYRTPAPTFNGGHFNSNPPYDNQTWSYGGGANTMGGTGRLKPSSRRAAIPPVRSFPELVRAVLLILFRTGLTQCNLHQPMA